MQPGTRKLLRFLQSWVINTFAVLVAAIVLRGHIAYRSPADLIVASLLLGILNAFVRPILMLLALPLLIFTLGLFTLVINALLLYFVGVLMGPALSSGQLRLRLSWRAHHQHCLHRAECSDRRRPRHRPAPPRRRQNVPAMMTTSR